MQKLNKAYKFRLRPNKKQQIFFAKSFGCTRFVYNQLLAERIEYYEKHKDNKDKLKEIKYSTPAKLKKAYTWLKEVDSLALANAQLNLKTAYKNFFRGNADFPRFKAKKYSKNSYTTNNVNNSIRIEGKKLRLPKVGFVRFIQHRQIPKDHKIKSCTISQTPTGKYYVSILTEYHKEITKKPVNKILGLDFSMNNLFVSSEGKKANYPQYLRKSEEKLAKEQRKLSRKEYDSNNYHKQRIQVAKIHEKIKNQRKDFLHKVSRKIADKFDAIIIEDLNMKTMSKCLNFAKSISDNAWGEFVSYLKYKLEEQGKQLIKIDKWFPSSKKCSNCGNVKDDLQLSDRVYKCNSCSLEIDRDINASLNIKEEGTSLLA